MRDETVANKTTRHTILVTGATSGIGNAIVKRLIKTGSRIIVIGRSTNRIEELASLLPPESVTINADLTNPEQIASLIEMLPQQIDGFIHAAGVESVVPVRNVTYQKFDSIMRVHVYSFVEIVKHIANQKKKGSLTETSIVAISSVASDSGGVGQTMYSASKAALEAVSRILSKELAEKNIRINVIKPGIVDTEMTRRWIEQIGIDDIRKIEKLQLRGLLKADEVADVATFLLSAKARGIAGSQIKVDAGGPTSTFF